MKKKKRFSLLLGVFLFVFYLVLGNTNYFAETQGNELTNVFYNIKFYDNKSEELITAPDTPYSVYAKIEKNPAVHKMSIEFDLSAYNGQLQGNDYFILRAPDKLLLEPAKAKTFTLAAGGKEIIMGDITKDGDNLRVTLREAGLKEYAALSGTGLDASDVRNIRGGFFLNYDVKANTIPGPITATFTGLKGNDQVLYLNVKERPEETPKESDENFAKINGLYGPITSLKRVFTDVAFDDKENMTSTALGGQKFNLAHLWRIRMNRSGKDWGTTDEDKLIIRDRLAQGGKTELGRSITPTKFIPELFVVREGKYLATSPEFENDPKTLERGKDYEVTFKNEYTEFELVIKNPGTRQFTAYYGSTGPGDATYVQNEAEMFNKNNVPINVNDSKGSTTYVVANKSIYLEGSHFTAAIQNKIIISKHDAKSSAPLSGAKFKITRKNAPEQVVSEGTTDEDGRFITKEDLIADTYIVEEVAAPEGYDKSPEKKEVILTEVDGIVRSAVIPFKNTRSQLKYEVSKDWDKTPEALQKDIQVKLYRDNVEVTGKITVSINDQAETQIEGPFTVPKGGKIQFNLPKYNFGAKKDYAYTVKELNENGNPIENDVKDGIFTVTYENTPAVTSPNQENQPEAPQKTVVKNTPDLSALTRSLKITKRWKKDRGHRVEFEILADNTVVQGKEVSLDGTENPIPWEKVIEGLPKYNERGNEISYTIREKDVDEQKYSIRTEGDQVNGYVVTNKNIEKVSISVRKQWVGPKKGPVSIQLTADNQPSKTLILNEENQWTAQFSDLDKYKEDGTEISYDALEIQVPEGYQSNKTKENGNFTFTNKNIQTIPIRGEKTWNDGNNQDGKRPQSITIRLFANGKQVGEKVVTEGVNGKWEWEFEDQRQYDDNGEVITYTISEDKVTDYSTEINQFNVTNSYTPAKTSVQVTKVWEDANNQDGIRPDRVTVQLYADDNLVNGKTLELNEGNKWQASFTELPVNKNGQPIKYTVKEENVPPGYTQAITGDAVKGFMITNSHTPSVTSVKISKVWDDMEDQSGFRPDRVTVQLYADEGLVNGKTLELNEGNKWQASFTELPVNKNGQPIKYTVKEENVPQGYTQAITGDAATGFTITNTHKPEPVTISVKKEWKSYLKKPVVIKLVKNGVLTDQILELNETNQWQGIFSNLNRYEKGKAIEYTIEEVKLPDYYSEIKGNMKDGFVVTNTWIRPILPTPPNETPPANPTPTPEQPTPSEEGKPEQPEESEQVMELFPLSPKKEHKPMLPKTGVKLGAAILWLAMISVSIAGILWKTKP